MPMASGSTASTAILLKLLPDVNENFHKWFANVAHYRYNEWTCCAIFEHTSFFVEDGECSNGFFAASAAC